MQNDYAYQCGAFMALAKMMRNSIRDLDADDEFTREWAKTVLHQLAEHTDEKLAQFGYTGVDAQ
jgi:CelD/BcsL family acetyltransferase involved in cellulose biosynthesis